MIELAVSLALLSLAATAALAYAVRVVRGGRAQDDRIDRAGASVLLGRKAMEMGYWAIRPFGRAALAMGISANAVSWTSLVLAGGAGVALGLGRFGSGAALSLGSSLCDAVDGLVARYGGTASEAGEVLDASVDRYAELLFFGGVGFGARSRPVILLVTLAASAGATMVSYSTAKAEALGVRTLRGAMRRPERAVYLGVGAALVPIVAGVARRWHFPSWLEEGPLVLALGLVAVVGNVSAVRRLRQAALATQRSKALSGAVSSSSRNVA